MATVLPDPAEQASILNGIACSLYAGNPPISDKIWRLFGARFTGKSTMLAIIKNFLGAQNCATVKLGDLDDADRRFSRFQLVGKLANFDSDGSVRSLRGDGYLKNIVGGDEVTVEAKGATPINVILPTTLWCAGNAQLITDDTTAAFANKVLTISFEVQHSKGSKPDRGMARKCTTPAECSGIFNRVLPQLQGLVSGDILIERTESQQANLDAFVKANYNEPIKTFVEELCEVFPSAVSDRPDAVGLEEVYDEWCDDAGIPKRKRQGGKRGFQETLKRDYAVAVQLKRSGSRTSEREIHYWYFGIALRDDAPPTQSEVDSDGVKF